MQRLIFWLTLLEWNKTLKLNVLADTYFFTNTIPITRFLNGDRVLIDFQYVSHKCLLVQPPRMSSKSLLSTLCRRLLQMPFYATVARPSASHLYCRASRRAVALDSYLPTSMLILSALLLHSSRVMVRRSFWDLRCSIRLQRKKNLFHNFTIGSSLICQYFSSSNLASGWKCRMWARQVF